MLTLHALMSKKREVTIRNKTYNSVTEAAEAIGVHRTTVVKAILRGTLEFVGLRKPGPKPFTVRSRNVIYRNVKECARENNVSISTVYTALRNGREDWIGERKRRVVTE